mmetsp:Transcript_28927/g.80885  ORF Transcript_28927/g.80885 Transcript_28927/m.80885 type:complete len:332 (+) Transcript_28927:76-1071(+)
MRVGELGNFRRRGYLEKSLTGVEGGIGAVNVMDIPEHVCPICGETKVGLNNAAFNRHVDECLNLTFLSQEGREGTPSGRTPSRSAASLSFLGGPAEDRTVQGKARSPPPPVPRAGAAGSGSEGKLRCEECSFRADTFTQLYQHKGTHFSEARAKRDREKAARERLWEAMATPPPPPACLQTRKPAPVVASEEDWDTGEFLSSQEGDDLWSDFIAFQQEGDAGTAAPPGGGAERLEKAEPAEEATGWSEKAEVPEVPAEVEVEPAAMTLTGKYFSWTITSTLDGECAICCEEYEAEMVLARLDCLCIYHKDCIDDWYSTKGERVCPIHVQYS